MLGLRFCARAFSSCGKRGPLFIAVRGPLTIAASLVAEHRLQKRRLSSCGSWAHLLRGMWDPPRPGLEPVSPALASRFSTTAPPGKPQTLFFKVSSTRTIQLLDKVQKSIFVTLKEAKISQQDTKSTSHKRKNWKLGLHQNYKYLLITRHHWDFPGGTVVKSLPANAGDTASIPGLGRSHMSRSN